MTTGIAAEPTRLRVAFRKNMQTPSPHELSARHANGKDLFAAASLIADSSVNGGEKSWRWAVEKCGALEWRIGC
jgi:hypothetical protein